MTILSFNLHTLAAARTHSAKNDVRYYLQGIQFNSVAGQIAATDGHRLFVANGLTGGICPSFILANDSVDAILSACKGLPKSMTPVIELEYLSATQVIVSTPIGKLTFSTVDHTFPDIQRVIPTGSVLPLEAQAGQYSGQYIADANKALGLFTNSKKKDTGYPIFQRGKADSAVMTAMNDDGHIAIVVIMPVRIEAQRDTFTHALSVIHNGLAKKTQESVAA